MWIMSVTQAMPLGGHARRDEVQVFEICLHTYTGVDIGAGALSGFIRFVCMLWFFNVFCKSRSRCRRVLWLSLVVCVFSVFV